MRKRQVRPPGVNNAPLSWKPHPNVVGSSGLCERLYICEPVIPKLLRQLTAPSGSGRKVAPREYGVAVSQSRLRARPPSFATQTVGGGPGGAPAGGGTIRGAWLSP